MIPRADSHLEALHAAWIELDAGPTITVIEELSAMVSTNRVFRVGLSDHTHVVAKVSSYGSYFSFAEDHDRIHRCVVGLQGTRFATTLADVVTRHGRPFTYYDGRLWVAFYRELERRRTLPRVLTPAMINSLGREMAEFHLACAGAARTLAPSSKSIKSDAIHLLDLLESPFAPKNFDLAPERIGRLRRHTHDLLTNLEAIGYDYWDKIPVLIDWNLGNFSVDMHSDDTFSLFSRWDYDWFRIEPRVMDFYFLSRVSSATGDRTEWAYSPHTLTEPSFVALLRSYHAVAPLTEAEIRFIPESYRFFILNYVVREGARFFQPELCQQFRREAASWYLPALDHLDIAPLLEVIA